jgi:hypothetical protein
LNDVYKKQCEYILVFLSDDYATDNKPWTGIEWKAVQEYAKDNANKIMLVKLEKFDDKKIKGLGKWAIYEDVTEDLSKFTKTLTQAKKDNLTEKLLKVIFEKISQK